MPLNDIKHKGFIFEKNWREKAKGEKIRREREHRARVSKAS